MDQREKLIELLSQKIYPREGVDPAEVVADYLLANDVVVLPCKVGYPAFWLHGEKITDCKVHRIEMHRTGMCLVLKSVKVHGAFRVNECLNKTVFLAREAAEAALRGARMDGEE